MKKLNKILSALLAVIMLVSAFSVIAGAIPAYDEDGKLIQEEGEIDYGTTVNQYLGYDKDGKVVGNFNMIYNTPQEKLASMEMMWEKYGYQLWVDTITGEVATLKLSTGEILFSNPWNAAANKIDGKSVTLDIKKRLLSQIIVNYNDNGVVNSMSSAADAASSGQINVEYIKTGIRVEYSIGREQTRMLVPRVIDKTRFETKILEVMREALNEEFYVVVSDGTAVDPYTGEKVANNVSIWGPEAKQYIGQTFGCYELIQLLHPNFKMSSYPAFDKVTVLEINKIVPTLAAYYSLQDPEDPKLTDSTREEMYTRYPITKERAVYVIDPNTTERELAKIENWIKTYAVSYTYEELDYDHDLTGYVGTEKAPPLFKMALEYSIDQNGMIVRLPANGIRYDESLYMLENIEMLPYMGAGANDADFKDGGDGYTFFPDGSGALFDFEQLNTNEYKSVTGKVYGQDYAYHKITGTYQEAIRYPAFGIVENYTGKKTVTDYNTVIASATYDDDGNLLTPTIYKTENIDVNEKKGFVAIIEEGDALAELSSVHESQSTIFNTVKMTYYPRPKDSYNMADAISVGANTIMTKTSERKYVGNYTVRYIILTDDKLAEENNLSSYYECSWLGMAVAYRDYLESINVLTRLEEKDVEDDIPLYVETFGTLMTTEKFLSVPMDVMTPLTTFEDITTMYTELSTEIEAGMKEVAESDNALAITKESAKNFSNINFKLTGYANGGMYATVPYHLNWESAVGGASGFEELVETAKKEGFGVFPDFDFAYIHVTDVFDGVSLDKHAVKTIDNRYTSRREYSATYQTYISYFDLAIAPSCFERFVTKLASNYLKYNPIGISVSTLGTDLNSDFNEDNPINREDSKGYTIEALKLLANLKNDDGNRLEIMTDGGNAYTWRFVDYILNMPLNSSRYKDASNAVPFIGVVLHGYVQYAGTPINEEGDIEMAMLKAIENGASIYFTLAYQNIEKFKEDFILNQYFSVRYDIWKEDLVDMYVELNNLLGDLQTKLIIDHEFLVGERVPDEDEVIADAEAKAEAERLEQLMLETEAAKQALKLALETRHTPANSIDSIKEMQAEADAYFAIIKEYVGKFNFSDISAVTDKKAEYSEYLTVLKDACDKLDAYRVEIIKAVAAAEAATKKIQETLVEYQQKAADAAIAVEIYRTAFFAAEFDAEELNELKEELEEEANATELDKKACANAIAISGKTVEELKASYEAAADADKAQAKILLEAATAVVENESDADLIEVKYNKAVSDKVTYDKKVVSYTQFSATAWRETYSEIDGLENTSENTEALQAVFEKEYSNAMALCNKKEVLEAKVFLFGSDNFTANETTFNGLVLGSAKDEYLANTKAYYETYIALWEELMVVALQYKEAKVKYDELLTKDISSMTEAERSDYVTDRINLSYDVVSSKTKIEKLRTEINDVISDFLYDHGYAQNNYKQLFNALSVMNEELATANALKEIIKSENGDTTEIDDIIANYEERINKNKDKYDAFETAFLKLSKDATAMENPLLIEKADGSFEGVAGTKAHETFIKELFAVAPVLKTYYTTTKYTCDDGSIVAVTYGGKDGDDDSAYRTFILNYNAFAVTVKYADVEYTLAPYSYAIINY